MDEQAPSSSLVLAAARSMSAALRVPYALCGGAACVVLGSQRETKAITLVVPRGSAKAARTDFRAHPAFKVEARTNYTTYIGEPGPRNDEGTEEHTERTGIPLTILSPPGLFSYNYTGAEGEYVLVEGIRVLHPRILILTKVMGIADRPMKKIISDANDVAFLMEKLWDLGGMVSLGELGFTSAILDKFVEIVPSVKGVLERMGIIRGGHFTWKSKAAQRGEESPRQPYVIATWQVVPFRVLTSFVFSNMPAPTAPRTPLRRVSQGSLRALSRSGVFPDAPYGLGFLEPVMAELADEVEGLHANVESLHALSRSLDSFNESFASFLYVMEMNALTTDWTQAPTDATFHLAKRRAEEEAKQAQLALQAAITTASEPTTSGLDDTTVGDATYANATMAQAGPSKPVSILKNGGPKKKAKPKLTAKERKERSLAIDKTVSCLPLEFRGQDPNLRRHVEAVIEGLMDSENNGIRMIDLIKPPDLNQARVNKCLIALANRKIVSKDKSTGEILYVWGGVPT